MSRRYDLCKLARYGAALGMVLASARGASATPQYPATLDAALGVSCPDPLTRCLICHTTALGGKTANQLFINKLRDRYGFARPNDPDGLRVALGLLSETEDSDDDGLFDKDELRACGNPSGEDLGQGPVYGCDGARLAPPVESGAGWFGAGVLGALLMAVRLRARALRTHCAALLVR